jgi:hypothetical protein
VHPDAGDRQQLTVGVERDTHECLVFKAVHLDDRFDLRQLRQFADFYPVRVV